MKAAACVMIRLFTHSLKWMILGGEEELIYRDGDYINMRNRFSVWLYPQYYRSMKYRKWSQCSLIDRKVHIIQIYIYVICRLGGPYSEKLWPRSWKCCPRPQAEGSIFKTEVTVFHYTDRPKPVNNLFIFFLSLKRLCLLTGKKLTQALCDRGQR